MRGPRFFSILGFLAILIASAFYGIYLLQSTLSPITITITAIVIACIILGMAQIMLGYEIRSIQRIQRITIERSITESQFERSPSSTRLQESAHHRPTLTETKIPRPHNFPPMTHKYGISVQSRGADDSNPSADLTTTLDPLKMTESERRLERLRQALRRTKQPPDKPPSESERKAASTLVGNVSTSTAYSPEDGFAILLVGREEIVLSSTITGEEFRIPCHDASVLETAWRAFAKGAKVKPIIQNRRIVRLELE